MKRSSLLPLSAAALIAGYAAIALIPSVAQDNASATTARSPEYRVPVSTEADATIYVCPMHPEVTSPNPGKCPKCGMDLKPKSK